MTFVVKQIVRNVALLEPQTTDLVLKAKVIKFQKIKVHTRFLKKVREKKEIQEDVDLDQEEKGEEELSNDKNVGDSGQISEETLAQERVNSENATPAENFEKSATHPITQGDKLQG